MVDLIVLLFAIISVLIHRYISIKKIDNTVMHYDNIGFTMADGKKEKTKK